VKFSADREELLRTNVGGAAQLLETLDTCAPAAHFHFISTAYVCGDRSGTCREDEGDVGQSFRQPYEQTKLLAEGVVRESCGRSGRPFTVYRPSIVCGSAADGAAANFHGLSSFLKAFDCLARLRERKPGIAGTVRIPCAAEGTKNVVPVDWLAAAICALVERPAPGRTYHLTHDRPLRHAEIREAIREVIGWEEVELSPPDGDLPLGAAQGILGATLRHFEPYLRAEPTFDRTALDADLRSLSSPPLLDRRYLERIVTFGRGVAWEPRPFERDELDAIEPCPTHRRPSCASC
jgi:nucleoside-diphosphate-sugar epimerase